ncbi:hypothetical protein E1B28_011329 [Marasmius oreades]|uniref:Uncharacterized protein n=1 Tax=Marasmius oreades TaxID=181124 RepID=A0A9P7RTW8_9AGAR|nr:uncharacterized protein E1B28_011329 [Marasmius oreades]KAG7089669.1 hypothetical protein E1B28_011329 [Marasmius oreades]
MNTPSTVGVPRSLLSTVFLLHVALEIPLAVQAIWAPASLPFRQLNNTTLVILKMYAALSLGMCLASVLCFSLPDILPGKRAFALGLCLYHTVCSTILFQAPRFIPYTFGPLCEQYMVTPEITWSVMHGLVGFTFMIWWQSTVSAVQPARKTN